MGMATKKVVGIVRPQECGDVACCAARLEKLRTTFAVCCFIDGVVLELEEANLSGSGYKHAKDVRRKAGVFLDQVDPTGKQRPCEHEPIGNIWETTYMAPD